MSYKPVARRYNLTFVDFPGLEITALSASLGLLTKLSNARIGLSSTEEERLEVFRVFASKVVSWNLTHPAVTDTPDSLCGLCGLSEDASLPVTVEGLLCLDLDFVMQIMIGWMEAVSKVTPGKSPNSNSGGSAFQEELMKELGKRQNPLESSTLNSSSD